MAGIPPIHTIPFVAGDTVKFKFQVLDPNPAPPPVDPDEPYETLVPRNLTGWSALSHVRRVTSSTTTEAVWSIAPLGAEGYIEMELSDTQTQSWGPLRSLVSDVQLTNLDGEVETILRIKLKVAQDVTRE